MLVCSRLIWMFFSAKTLFTTTETCTCGAIRVKRASLNYRAPLKRSDATFHIEWKICTLRSMEYLT